jgi:hypothetical protein
MTREKLIAEVKKLRQAADALQQYVTSRLESRAFTEMDHRMGRFVDGLDVGRRPEARLNADCC